MFGSWIPTILGLVSAVLWAREIWKAYREYSIWRPSTLAYLRQEGSAMFGVGVALCGFCLAASLLVVVWGAVHVLPRG